MRSGKPDSERKRRLLLIGENLLVSGLSDDDFFIAGDELELEGACPVADFESLLFVYAEMRSMHPVD